MSETLKSIENLPDVSFTDNDTVDAMLARLIANYEAKYTELTGTVKSLSPADPMRILMHAVALDLYQIEQYVERAGKQDLLKYSYGEFLDNLAAGRGVTRHQAAPAGTTIRFTLSAPQNVAVGIPEGTRVTNGNGVYFITTEYGEALPRETFVDVPAVCTEDGTVGNDLLPGQLNILVDNVNYIESASNTVISSGGSFLETDESLAERVFLAPSSYSVAGPAAAYEYHVRSYNPNIGSVKVTSDSPCEVSVYVLMADGSLPSDSVIAGLEDYLSGDEIRPLTDNVTVLAPESSSFVLTARYYIRSSDAAKESTIRAAVAQAVDDYVTWQTSEIGRDINPSELVARIMTAGVKRVIVSNPEFTTVGAYEIARLSSKSVVYGGLEDD